MKTPVTDTERERILELARGGMGCRQIERETGRSRTTVSNICAAAGVSFDRSATKAAVAAKRVDNAARRTELSRRLLEQAHDLLDRIHKPHLVFNFNKDGEYTEVLLDGPTTGDIRNLMVSAGIAVQRHAELERFDAEVDGLAAVDQWLRSMVTDASG